MITKFTKIVATIGPATNTLEGIKALYEGGMNAARLNFSHGSYDYFGKVIDNIRKIDEKICIILDTRGPEIRTNDFKGEGVNLEVGQKIFIENSTESSDEKTLRLNYSHLGKIHNGSIIHIDDGLITARVVSNDEIIEAEILNGGFLGNKKGVTFKGHNVCLPCLTDKDKEDILFGIKKDVDYVAVSYVREASDVNELRDFLKKNNSNAGIIAKIEHGSAVENIDEIIEAADGVMIARGDLGVELELEKVPLIQRELINKCNKLGRPVIVATQMLESMNNSPKPTRAEVSDVANAILQGADAVMLSSETAKGKYPNESVRVMRQIASVFDAQVENVFAESLYEQDEVYTNEVSLFVTKAAYLASKSIKTAAILTPTESGYTARKVARFKPKCPVLAITRNRTVLRQLQISWGVFPEYEPAVYTSVENYINDLAMLGMQRGFLAEDDVFVITMGHKLHQPGTTNLLEIYNVSEIIERMNN
ncbi:MAG: pyruvate kinase [Candidatus Nanoarchaeia archaeon]